MRDELTSGWRPSGQSRDASPAPGCLHGAHGTSLGWWEDDAGLCIERGLWGWTVRGKAIDVNRGPSLLPEEDPQASECPMLHPYSLIHSARGQALA